MHRFKNYYLKSVRKIKLVLFYSWEVFFNYVHFLAKRQKRIYQNKLEEFQQSNQDNQFKKEVLDRYKNF